MSILAFMRLINLQIMERESILLKNKCRQQSLFASEATIQGAKGKADDFPHSLGTFRSFENKA